VSLYIPAKENLNKIVEMLTGELSAAAGIKSKQTRTSVCTAINTTKESKRPK
jgi:peptide subunit release factor 1 (eRF1)